MEMGPAAACLGRRSKQENKKRTFQHVCIFFIVVSTPILGISGPIHDQVIRVHRADSSCEVPSGGGAKGGLAGVIRKRQDAVSSRRPVAIAESCRARA